MRIKSRDILRRSVIFFALSAALREIYEAIFTFHHRIKVINHAEPQRAQSYFSTLDSHKLRTDIKNWSVKVGA